MRCLLLRSTVSMAPTAGSSLQCEPVFDLIADKMKQVRFVESRDALMTTCSSERAYLWA